MDITVAEECLFFQRTNVIVKRKNSAMIIVIYFIREYFIREEYQIAFIYDVSWSKISSVLLLIFNNYILLYINQKDDKAYS